MFTYSAILTGNTISVFLQLLEIGNRHLSTKILMIIFGFKHSNNSTVCLCILMLHCILNVTFGLSYQSLAIK